MIREQEKFDGKQEGSRQGPGREAKNRELEQEEDAKGLKRS